MYFTIHTSSSTNILYVYNGTSRYPLHFGSTTPRPSSLNLRISSSQRSRTLCDTIFQLLFLSSPMVIVYLEFNKCQQLFKIYLQIRFSTQLNFLVIAKIATNKMIVVIILPSKPKLPPLIIVDISLSFEKKTTC